MNLEDIDYSKNINPQKIIDSRLETISGINFTPRELDVIACILGGRTAKKIADYLRIKTRTVEHHCANIMKKLGCNSQERIIDFCEKSEEFTLLKKRYISLRAEHEFEEELHKIAKIVHKKTLSCLILCNEVKLEKYLSLAGVTLFVKKQESLQNYNQLTASISSEKIDYIIQYSSINSSKNENASDENLNKVIDIIQVYNQDPSDITDCRGQPSAQNFVQIGTFDLSDPQMYYHVVFSILQKLFPNDNFEKHVENFEKIYEKIFKIEYSETKHVEKCLPSNSTLYFSNDKSWIHRLGIQIAERKVKITIFALTIFLFFSLSIITLVKINKETHLFGTFALNSDQNFSKNKAKTVNPNLKWNLPRRDQAFIGREVLLKNLESSLNDFPQKKSADDNAHNNYLIKNRKIAICACAGLGGIGKTQLALQYIHHCQKPYTLRAWFPAENLEQLKQEYFRFAKKLGHSEEQSTFEDVLVFVKNWLEKNPGWLIVYDNVNSYLEIQPFLPENGGHVIITSRMRHWPDTFVTLPIDVMTEEEAINLLNASIRNTKLKEINEKRELAKTLGYLPLALAQAGAYIHQNQISVSNYLQLYKTHETELLSTNPTCELANNTSVATTWNISLSKLVQESIENHEPLYALDLIMVCAYLAPENISRDFLLTWFKEAYPNLKSHDLILPRIIGQLWKYSLIHTDDEKSIGIHRLLQSVLRTQHNRIIKINNNVQYPARTVQWFDKVLLTCAIYYELFAMEGQFLDQNFLSHLQSLEAQAQLLQLNNPRLRFAKFSNMTGMTFYSLGDLKSALYYFMRALKIAESESVNDKSTIGYVYNNIGLSLDIMGDPKNANVYLDKSLKMAQQYPNEYDFLEITMSNLGQNYKHLGEAQKAKQLLEKSAELIAKRYGNDGVWAAMNLCRLGEVYGDLGDNIQARDTFKKALTIREKYFGKNDRKVAETLISLAEVYINSGEPKAAKESFQRSLDIYEKVYGKNHILNARILTGLGSAFRELNNPVQSKKILEEALLIRKQYYNSEHLHVIETLEELGKTYAKLGDFQQAKNLLEEARKFQSQYYGENHIIVGNILFHLSQVYLSLKDINTARDLMKISHTIFMRSYGKEHSLTKKSDNLFQQMSSH